VNKNIVNGMFNFYYTLLRDSWRILGAGQIMEESSLDNRKAVICFQYVERIKSELIIAVKLLEKLSELEGDEFAGAEKMMLHA
jgi:hypothetical protein